MYYMRVNFEESRITPKKEINEFNFFSDLNSVHSFRLAILYV